MAIENPATLPPPVTSISPASSADAVYKKLTYRVVGLILLCYFFAYLDRVNVGFAKLQMVNQLRLSETAYGFGAGLFFLSYLLLQIPAGYFVNRFGVRTCLAGSMFLWGIVSIATLLTTNEISFYVARFFLGVTEASFFPAAVAYFSIWFPSFRLSKVMSLLFLAIPVGVIVGGPLSGWIMDATHGRYGMQGWQWMFLLEGTPAVLLGVYLYFVLTERIDDARWLTEFDRTVVREELSSESEGKKTSLGPALREPTLWLLFLIAFLYNLGNHGLVFWLPTMIKAMGKLTNFQIGVISAIPYLVSAVAMVANAQHSVRTGERRWHTAVPVFVGGLALLGCVATQSRPVISVFCLTVGIAGIMCTLATFWSLPSRILAGTAAAGGAGLVNIGSGLAGFIGPLVMGILKQWTGSTAAGVALLAVTLFLAGILVLCIPRRYISRD